MSNLGSSQNTPKPITEELSTPIKVHFSLSSLYKQKQDNQLKKLQLELNCSLNNDIYWKEIMANLIVPKSKLRK